jgi:hypothetical protein
VAAAKPASAGEEDEHLTGFIIATLVPAPPVYDPGGLTCLIDDFVVAPAAKWPTTGPVLLRAALDEVARRGAAQAVVVTAHLDRRKRQALRSCGLQIASEWWLMQLQLRQDPPRRIGGR